MAKHCLDDTFYVQGVPVSTSAATVARGRHSGRRVVTYDDFASRRREALATFATVDERRAFERLPKADQCAALGVVLNTALDNGEALYLRVEGNNVQLIVDVKAMTGRRGRGAFDPDGYIKAVGLDTPLGLNYQSRARATYASLALAHLDANGDLGESQPYADEVVKTFLENCDEIQLTNALISTALADYVARDGHVGHNDVENLIARIEGHNIILFDGYTKDVMRKDVATVGDALQFVVLASRGAMAITWARYQEQLQTACALFALEPGDRISEPYVWAKEELTRVSKLQPGQRVEFSPPSADAHLVENEESPESLARHLGITLDSLSRSSSSIDYFATKPLTTRAARDARARRSEIESTINFVCSDRASMEEFATALFKRPIVTVDDALIFATFCRANPWRPEGISFKDTDPQYEHALHLLSATSTIETAAAITYLRSELHASQPDEEMFFPPKDPFAPAETRLAAAQAQERFEAARQARATMYGPEVVPASEPHAAILNAYPDTRHLQQTTSPLRERERAAYDKYEAAHLALEFASLRGENEPGEVVQAQKAQIALWQEWQDLFVALSNERSTARQN